MRQQYSTRQCWHLIAEEETGQEDFAKPREPATNQRGQVVVGRWRRERMAEEEPRFAEQVTDKPIVIKAAELRVEVEWLEIKVEAKPN